jgi:uracil-DNA glycosylase
MSEQPLFLAEGVAGAGLQQLREAAETCTNCHLYKDATQTVFGKGPERARLMLVGEQPGDQEDLAGEPFVGPAGRMLDRALVDAGIDRTTVYVTNAVKHFKFTPRGKRRIHSTPNAEEVKACKPWLVGELAAIQPDLVVALGATAAKALIGPKFKVTKQRGEIVEVDGQRMTATLHPSALLRLKDPERTEAIEAFTDDFRTFAALLEV